MTHAVARRHRSGASPLEESYDRLERLTPDVVARAIAKARKPSARWVRIPLGLLCLAGGVLWFLPMLGVWMLPLGLLLLAQDIPFMRRPVGRMMLWLLDRWDSLARRISRWRKRRASRH